MHVQPNSATICNAGWRTDSPAESRRFVNVGEHSLPPKLAGLLYRLLYGRHVTSATPGSTERTGPRV